MNIKMKLLIITFVSLLSYTLVGCGNSPKKQQTEITNPLEIAFKKVWMFDSICRNCKDDITWDQMKDSTRYFIYTDIVKERILNLTSQRYFDKLAALITRSIDDPVIIFNVDYEDNIYKYRVYEHNTARRMGTPTIELNYDPQYDCLTSTLMENGKIVQANGEIHYNTEGWDIELTQTENEFGEVDKTYYVAQYVISSEEAWDHDKFVTLVFKNAIFLWTNELGDLSDINAILVKDHDSGKVYNIQYDERYHNSSRRNDHDIGVVISNENMFNFLDLISGLTNFSILIKSNYDISVLISRPENFNNIKDVYNQIIANTIEMENDGNL